MRMERRVGSGVLKKKNSSGCLIIKKPGLNKNTGGGFGGEIESSEAKKRGRLVESDSSDDSSESDSSSDEDESLEFMRRKACDKRLKNGAMGYKRKELENSEHDRGRDNAGSEMKRSRMDLFEFDEYDEFDEAEMRNEFFGHGFKGSGKMKGSGVSSKRNFVVDKRRFDGSGSRKSKGKGLSGVGNKGLESEDDEAMPISLLRLKYQETAGESIRLQGKNGVLKVMVNKKKKVDIPSQPVVYERKERKGSRSDDAKKDVVQSPVSSDLKTPEKRGLMVDKEKKVQPSSKGKKAGNSEVDGVETVLKLATPRPEASSSKKREKTEFITPVKGKEGKEGSAKRAGSTEKQRLREQIRQMLLDAGWTIDLRPRRNRDYLDSVYINPSGTAYWSIVKAYDAFKKQSGEDNGTVKADVGSPSSAPLSEDMINKLTRQTKKKIEEAMKRKRKEASMSKSAKKGSESSDSDESDDRLSSFMNKKQKSRGISSKVDTDRIIQGRASKVPGRCTLLVRGSNTDENSDVDGFVQYSGKRTVLAWLIDCGTAKLSEKVQYMNRRRSRVMLEGWITRDGIHCGCCSKILTVSKFELHAGSKLRQPYQNIFLESGSSLLQCQIDAWNSQEESARQDYFTVDVDGDDPDDDTCGICGDGGDLICCDSCPSTFHQICLGIQLLPSGDWHCPHCTCKFCGSAAEHAAEKDNSTGNELDRCHFCEKKYHKSCSERECTLPQSSNEASFCGPKCQEIYDHLEKILGIKHELEAGISWSLIQRKDLSDTSQRGFPVRVECNAKLAVASSAMDECFLPINDRRSGLNMIHNVVYNCGSNFNRLNFCRFYTAILERGDEIIAAASIRIHGDCLAEMPFIATRMIYRRQGMCRRLLSAIETELRSLKVRQLVIPAISEHMNTWTTVFGFHELTDVHKKEIKTMNMLVFPGTDMLQKTLLEDENSDGAKVSGSTNSQQQQLPIPVKKSEVNSSVEQNREVNSSVEQNREASSDSEEQNGQESKMEVDVLTTPSGEGGVHESNNAAPDVVCESDVHLLDKGSTAEMENTQKESSENKPNAMDDSNGCKIEAPCLKSSPVSSDETREAADANGGIERGNELSEDAEPSNIVSNGRLEPHPGYVSELSSAVKATHKNQDSAPISASVDEESTVAECDVVVDHPEIDKPELSSAVKVTHKNHDSAPIFALISAASGIVGPDADLDSMALHDSAPISAPISAASVDEGPDADLDSTALNKAENHDSAPISAPISAGPDTDLDSTALHDPALISAPISAASVIEGPDADLDSTALLKAENHDSAPISAPISAASGIVGPDADLDSVALHDSAPISAASVDEGPDADLDSTALLKAECDVVVDRPEVKKPDGEINAIDLPESNESLSITQVAVDCSENDTPYAENKSTDRPQTSEPNGKIEVIDLPKTNEDMSMPQVTVDCPENDKPYVENKSTERPQTSEPNGGIDTIDLPETNEDLSIPHVVVDCPTTDKPGGENWTINHPETNEDLSVPIDGEKGTIETNELGEKNKSIEYAESDEPNEHQTRLVMQNTAATEDMSSDFQF